MENSISYINLKFSDFSSTFCLPSTANIEIHLQQLNPWYTDGTSHQHVWLDDPMIGNLTPENNT